MKKQVLLILMLVFIFTGCSKIDYISYKYNPTVNDDTSIVILGVEGSKYVNYFQFLADKFPPALNFREPALSGEIMLFRVDTPLNDLDLHVITSGVAGYIGIGATSFGYRSVEAKSLNIKERGIYYYGVLNTDTLVVDHRLREEVLQKVKSLYGKDFDELNLKPINFKW